MPLSDLAVCESTIDSIYSLEYAINNKTATEADVNALSGIYGVSL